MNSVSFNSSSDNGCQLFKLNDHSEVEKLYRNLRIRKLFDTEVVQNIEGNTASIGVNIYKKIKGSKIGIMIAANSGLPGGGLGKRPSTITEKDLSVQTQEESIWANAVITECGTDAQLQTKFHENTIKERWGLCQIGDSTDIKTIQGIDYTRTTKTSSYNGAYILEGRSFSDQDANKKIIENSRYPVTFVFADSINANASVGTPSGTMQRTLNQKAIEDFEFFLECVKTKMRSALDAMAACGVTHPIVAKLSCGIYSGKHKDKINENFHQMLNEILSETVGPSNEKRGQYFDNVILPIRKETSS